MGLRVLHLAGSAVSDFSCDLSRLYAQECLRATADPSRYEFHIAYVTPDRQWRFPSDLSRDAIAASPPMSLAEAVTHLAGLDLDVMVPQMFCVPGMTHYRGLFDLLGVPYVGNTPDVMALAAHKARAKAVVAAVGVNVPRGELLQRGDQPTLAPPTIIKPVDTDNSIGLALVRDRVDYDVGLRAAFAHSDEVLVEAFVDLGREVRCGVVGRDGQLVSLPLEEYDVDPVRRPIRSYDDKISRKPDGELNLVAKDTTKAWIVDRDDPVTQAVWDAAEKCHVALGARHYSLFDFRIDQRGVPWFLEAGLYCSFAPTSVITMMSDAAGTPLDELFDAMLRHALR